MKTLKPRLIQSLALYVYYAFELRKSIIRS